MMKPPGRLLSGASELNTAILPQFTNDHPPVLSSAHAALSASPKEKPLILVGEKIHKWEHSSAADVFQREMMDSCELCEVMDVMQRGKGPYFIERWGRDWPSLMGIISAHWLRWAATLGRADSHWDRSGALPDPLSAPPIESQYFNGSRIFQWQLLAEQSSRGGLDRARRAAAVCVCVCVRICQSAGVCGEDFFSLVSSPFTRVNGVVIWLAWGENEGLGSHGC